MNNDLLNKNNIKELTENLTTLIHKNMQKYNKIVIFNIGTDRYIGDALAPIVGTLLEKQNVANVWGTLDNPIHAINLKKRISMLDDDCLVIAIDACLGNNDNIGVIKIKEGFINPGKGVGKSLPAVGNIAITGIVDDCDSEGFLMLHNIRLSLVMNMAETISTIVKESVDTYNNSLLMT
jgi:putative sporulation protein YyaC